MKKLTWLLVAVGVFGVVIAPASGLSAMKKKSSSLANEATSRITEVTVFKDRASVKRRRRLTLAKGAATLIFSHVTPLADLESLKVSLSEKGGLTLMGIRTQSEFSLHSGNTDLENWTVRRRTAESKRQEIMNQVNLLVQSNQNLELLTQHYRDSFSLNIHQNTWTKGGFEAFIKFLTTQSDQLNGAWGKLYTSFQSISKEIEFANAKIQELSSASDRNTITVSVDLLAEKPVSSEVEIQYLVSRCGWSPTYDLRVDTAEGRATVEQNAFVWQKTGEDWPEVALTLSNVRSELRPVLPTISPYTLSYHEVKKVETSVTGAVDSAQSLTVGGPTSEPTSEAEEKGLDRVFHVPGLQTVRDGMARTRVFLAKRESIYSERLELAAAEYSHVFRKGQLENPFDWDLEGGSASVYYDGSFLQQIAIESVAKGNKFGINAGIDYDFQISRWTNDRMEKAGILDPKKHFLREVNISLHNFSDRRKSVRVYEQIPISEIKEVAVETKKNTAGLQRDEVNPGWHYWDLPLGSKNSQTVSLSLDVAVPPGFNFAW